VSKARKEILVKQDHKGLLGHKENKVIKEKLGPQERLDQQDYKGLLDRMENKGQLVILVYKEKQGCLHMVFGWA
jgi:hypothetical protein